MSRPEEDGVQFNVLPRTLERVPDLGGRVESVSLFKTLSVGEEKHLVVRLIMVLLRVHYVAPAIIGA